MITFILLTIIASFCHVSGIILSILEFDIVGLFLLFLFLLSFISWFFCISANTKKTLRKNQIYTKRVCFNSLKEIRFWKENSVWKTNIDSEISFDLSMCIMQRKYIEAFVTRLLRYNENDLTVKMFFRRKCALKRTKCKDKFLYINNKRICIIRNGYSIQSILAQVISQSVFIENYLFMRSVIPFINNRLTKINEKDFVNKFHDQVIY